MYKKLLIGTLVLLITIFSFSFTFAANEIRDAANSIGNGVKDIVGGAANGIEDAAKGVSNASKGATANVVETANSVGNRMMENGDNNNTNKDTNNNMGDNMDSNNYTATRTSTGNGDTTLMGMNATAWTWLIIGIAGIAIIALVWYYGSQLRTSHDSDRD